MRSFHLVAIGLVVLFVAGCDEFALVTRPAPQFLELETWRNVPEGEEIVNAKVGEVLHLPLKNNLLNDPDLLITDVVMVVNGEKAKQNYFDISGKKASFVFKAEQPGQFHIEKRGMFDTESKTPQQWTINVSK